MDNSQEEIRVTGADVEIANLTSTHRRNSQCIVVSPSRFRWNEFLSDLKSAALLGSITYLRGKNILWRDEVILIAAGADRVGNRLLWENACTCEEMRDCWEKDSMQVSKRRVTEAALGVCIEAGLEDFCCGLAENSPYVVPLWVIHRAGECGFMRYLLTLSMRRIPVETNKVIESMPWKVQRILRRKSRNKWPRFPANKPYLEFCDVLKWACLTQTEEKIRELIENVTEIDDAAVASVLISEGFFSLLEQLIDQEVFRMTVSGMLVLIEHKALTLACKILKVSSK